MSEIVYQPIGTLVCNNSSPHEAPRQAVLAKDSEAYIILEPQINLDCISDLKGFSRIWLVYDFHKSKTWKPKVRPPRGSETKKSVLATRSPYRPNSIGMSCVKLEKIKGQKIYISEHDLLNQTPILDIKPYIVYADSFPNESQGWLEDIKEYEVTYSEEALEKITWLSEQLDSPLQQTITQQLSYEPTNSKIKGVKANKDHFVFSFKTWRVDFNLKDNIVSVFNLRSGYSTAELDDPEDQYSDKNIHNAFKELYYD